MLLAYHFISCRTRPTSRSISRRSCPQLPLFDDVRNNHFERHASARLGAVDPARRYREAIAGLDRARWEPVDFEQGFAFEHIADLVLGMTMALGWRIRLDQRDADAFLFQRIGC